MSKNSVTYPKLNEVINIFNYETNTEFLKEIGCEVHNFINPGNLFSKAEQSELYKMLVEVTSVSFGADMTSYWALRKQQNYFSKLEKFSLITRTDSQIVGWTGFSIVEMCDNGLIMYIDSTGIVPELQSSGIMTYIAKNHWLEYGKKRLTEFDNVYITARTESPVFYKLLQKISNNKNLYPCVGVKEPKRIIECGKFLASYLNQLDILEENSLILRNAYDVVDELYGELPFTGNNELDELFRKKLGPLDAYLIILELGDNNDTI